MWDVPVIMLEFQQSMSFENLEVPQIQLIDEVVDIPVVSQRQVPTVLSFVLQVQFLEVVDMPAVVQRQVPAVAVCRQGGQHPFVAQRQIPMVPSVQKTIAIPLLQCVDKVVYVLVVQVVQVSPVQLWRSQAAPTVADRRENRCAPAVLGQGCCMPVGVQQQVLVVTVQKTAEVPHVQFIDKVVAVPVDFLLYGGYGGDEGVFGLF